MAAVKNLQALCLIHDTKKSKSTVALATPINIFCWSYSDTMNAKYTWYINTTICENADIGFYITSAHKQHKDKDWDDTDSMTIGLGCGNMYLLWINHYDYS